MVKPTIHVTKKSRGLPAWLFHFSAKAISPALPPVGGKKDRPLRRILFVGPDHLGDLLLVRSLLARVAEDLPETERVFSGRLPDDRFLRRAFPVDLCLGESLGVPGGGWKDSLSRWREYMESLRPDMVFPLAARSDCIPVVLAARLEGVPFLLGAGDKGYGPLLSHPVYFPERPHFCEAPHRLWDHWRGVPSQSYAVQWPESLLPPATRPADIILSPFAQHLRRWSIVSWRTLARRLHESGYSLALVGSDAFRSEADDFLMTFDDDRKPIDLVGKTDLEGLFSVVRGARLIITLCTGTRHVAAATGTPAVVLGHGGEAIEVIGPYWEGESYLRAHPSCDPCGDAVCRFGHYACVRNVEVDAVYAEVLRRLDAE